MNDSTRQFLLQRIPPWCLILVVALLGCQKRQPPLHQRVIQCAELQGALASPNAELMDQVSQIVAHGEGPQQLTPPSKPPEKNAAALLADKYRDADRLRVIPQLRELAAPNGTTPSLPTAAAMRALLTKENTLLQIAVQAVERPSCDSGARFDLGFFERYFFLDDGGIACRLQLCAAYVALADDDRPLALLHATGAARWAHWMASEPRLEGRLLGAQLRREWLALVQVIASSNPTQQELATLYGALREMLDTWPPDRRAWVGDRALTLHAYEAIRAGMIDRVLTSDEEEILNAEGRLDSIRALSGTDLDQDQLVYLETMQEIVASASNPYFERVDKLAEVLLRVEKNGPQANYAPLACGLLLDGLPFALEQMARDRALCEAWLLAIASAGKFDLPPYRINPLSGAAYQAERVKAGVLLRLNDPETLDPFVQTPREASGS